MIDCWDLDVSHGLKGEETREILAISERMRQVCPRIYGMATPNCLPDELMLKVERPLFAWMPLSDERISGKSVIFLNGDNCTHALLASPSMRCDGPDVRTIPYRIYGAHLIWGGRCSGLRPAKDAFLIIPFGFIMERMVTGPKCFDVRFVFGTRLDLLSTHLLQC